MNKNRLEAFSDGVIAIIITIMVLEIKVPHGAQWSALVPLLPVFFSYALSFMYVGIYWNNHHHTFHAVHKVNGAILLANLHLLFWLSLLPFVSGWMGENHFSEVPMFAYGFVLSMSAIAYTILIKVLLAHHSADSPLAKAIGSDRKGKASLFIYILGMVMTFVNPWISFGMYSLVAMAWLIPDRRIEKVLNKE